MSAAYIVATSEPPAIVCPAWCARSQEEHREELAGWEGMVIHRGAGADVVGSAETFPDGTPDPEESPMIFVYGDDASGLSLDRAEALAHEILRVVREVRG